MQTCMINIDHLVKRYGNKYAVNDISFKVGEGEIVGFLGPNGAGKSTTMNILTGYLSYTSGTVEVGGLDIIDHAFEVKKMIGYLPEQPPLYSDMTVEDYLNFVYDLKKCTFNRKKHIMEICEVVRIADVYKQETCPKVTVSASASRRLLSEIPRYSCSTSLPSVLTPAKLSRYATLSALWDLTIR